MAYNSPILGPSGVGLLGSNNKLTKSAREAFVSQVILLLAGGNLKGKGPKVSSILNVPFPPIPGPKLFDPDKALLDPSDPTGQLFWFNPSPLVLPMTPFLVDPEKDYQKIIVTNLYEPLVRMLNVPGNIVAPVLFDPTCFFDLNFGIDIPSFLLELNATLPIPALHASFADKFDLSIGSIGDLAASLPTIPSPPPIPPSVPVPKIPDFDFIIFPDLFLSILTLPLEILKPDFVISLITSPSPDFGGIFLKIVEIVLGIILKALEKIGLLAILPKLLSSTIIVILQNMISMMVCDIIGSVLGTGQVVKAAGSFLGLS